MKDYFIYLPDSGESSPWQCVATACGHTRVRPGSDYPPHRHPVDHHFNWANGRVLSTYQIVFISEGQGWFESMDAQASKQRIEAGSLFLLFPGIWHRYGPDRDVGWVEDWIECSGDAFDRAFAQNMIRPEQPVTHPGLDPALLSCFEQCHALAHRSAPGRQSALATLGLHILALLQQLPRSDAKSTKRIEQTVLRAQSLIEQRCQKSLNMERLARELGEGYSNFRQAFSEITGLSPKQYHVQVRLRRAKELMANTSKSVKEISEILGFDSPFHFSKQFKAHTGTAPLPWRRRLQNHSQSD